MSQENGKSNTILVNVSANLGSPSATVHHLERVRFSFWLKKVL